MVGECEAQEGGQEKMKERKTSGKWSCMEAGRRTAGGAECGSVRAHVPQRSSSSTVLLLLPPSDAIWSPPLSFCSPSARRLARSFHVPAHGTSRGFHVHGPEGSR